MKRRAKSSRKHTQNEEGRERTQRRTRGSEREQAPQYIPTPPRPRERPGRRRQQFQKENRRRKIVVKQLITWAKVAPCRSNSRPRRPTPRWRVVGTLCACSPARPTNCCVKWRPRGLGGKFYVTSSDPKAVEVTGPSTVEIDSNTLGDSAKITFTLIRKNALVDPFGADSDPQRARAGEEQLPREPGDGGAVRGAIQSRSPVRQYDEQGSRRRRRRAGGRGPQSKKASRPSCRDSDSAESRRGRTAATLTLTC